MDGSFDQGAGITDMRFELRWEKLFRQAAFDELPGYILQWQNEVESSNTFSVERPLYLPPGLHLFSMYASTIAGPPNVSGYVQITATPEFNASAARPLEATLDWVKDSE